MNFEYQFPVKNAIVINDLSCSYGEPIIHLAGYNQVIHHTAMIDNMLRGGGTHEYNMQVEYPQRIIMELRLKNQYVCNLER